MDVAPATAMDDLVAHLDHGWVYSSPTAFGMAMVKDSTWSDDELAESEIWALPEEGDLWYFTRIAGSVAEVLSRLPFPLEWCAWHRHKGEDIKVNRHEFHTFCRKFRSRPLPIDLAEPRTIGFTAQRITDQRRRQA